MSDLNFSELDKNNKEEDNFNPLEVYKKYQIDLKAKPMKPRVAISFGVNDTGDHKIFATYGNISTIKGEEKARKSFFKSLIEACCFGGKSKDYTDYLDICSVDLGDKYLISIDTEQDEYYAWLNSNRVQAICGFIPKNYKYFYLREFSPRMRLIFLEWLLTSSEISGKIGIVVLDGYKDFVVDYNSLLECQEFVGKLMSWSSKYKCHITGIIHVNAGSEKAKGHIGSIVQEKSETILQIKDEGDYSRIYFQRSRGVKLNEFHLNVENHLPKIMCPPTNKKGKDKDNPF